MRLFKECPRILGDRNISNAVTIPARYPPRVTAIRLVKRIINNPVKEIGWLPAYSHGTRTHFPDWLNRFTTPQKVFHWHGETFELPAESTQLLSSQHCENQAFLYKDNVLAFQCHIEMTESMVDEWSLLYEDELLQPSDTIQTRAEMQAGSVQYIDQLNKLADEIYQNWIGQLGTSAS